MMLSQLYVAHACIRSTAPKLILFKVVIEEAIRLVSVVRDRRCSTHYQENQRTNAIAVEVTIIVVAAQMVLDSASFIKCWHNSLPLAT